MYRVEHRGKWRAEFSDPVLADGVRDFLGDHLTGRTPRKDLVWVRMLPAYEGTEWELMLCTKKQGTRTFARKCKALKLAEVPPPKGLQRSSRWQSRVWSCGRYSAQRESGFNKLLNLITCYNFLTCYQTTSYDKI